MVALKPNKDLQNSKSRSAKTQDVAVLILAGGYSERMRGRKAVYKLNGAPLIKYVFDRVEDLSRELVVSCKAELEMLQEMFPAAKIVLDKEHEKGPLVGLASTLPHIESEYVAVLACDCPLIEPKLIELLLNRARGHDGAVLRWPNGFIEPLQAVYQTKILLKAVEAARKKGISKLGAVVASLKNVVYLVPEELRSADPKLDSFRNINSPDDLPNFR